MRRLYVTGPATRYSEGMAQHGDPELARFPVGFERFHRRPFFNYQLNRAHALGYADRDQLHRAAAMIRSQADCVVVFACADSSRRSWEAWGDCSLRAAGREAGVETPR